VRRPQDADGAGHDGPYAVEDFRCGEEPDGWSYRAVRRHPETGTLLGELELELVLGADGRVRRLQQTAAGWLLRGGVVGNEVLWRRGSRTTSWRRTASSAAPRRSRWQVDEPVLLRPREVEVFVLATLGPSKRPAGRVTVGGHTYRTTVASIGGQFLVPLSADNRAATRVSAGDEVDVDIEPDDQLREVAVPAVPRRGTSPGCRGAGVLRPARLHPP